jgi:hypothetical protein
MRDEAVGGADHETETTDGARLRRLPEFRHWSATRASAEIVEDWNCRLLTVKVDFYRMYATRDRLPEDEV